MVKAARQLSQVTKCHTAETSGELLSSAPTSYFMAAPGQLHLIVNGVIVICISLRLLPKDSHPCFGYLKDIPVTIFRKIYHKPTWQYTMHSNVLSDVSQNQVNLPCTQDGHTTSLNSANHPRVQEVVADVCTVTQPACARQEVDMQLAKHIADVKNTQLELANYKVQ